MKRPNVWKLQDAKARFSEVVRKARTGAPQKVTVHGKETVVILDCEQFDYQEKARQIQTMAEFIEASKKYRGLLKELKLDRSAAMPMRDKRKGIFDGDYSEE